jgi:hypothetical protein
MTAALRFLKSASFRFCVTNGAINGNTVVFVVCANSARHDSMEAATSYSPESSLSNVYQKIIIINLRERFYRKIKMLEKTDSLKPRALHNSQGFVNNIVNSSALVAVEARLR